MSREKLAMAIEASVDALLSRCDTTAQCAALQSRIATESANFNRILTGLVHQANNFSENPCNADMFISAANEAKQFAARIGVATEGSILSESDIADTSAYLTCVKDFTAVHRTLLHVMESYGGHCIDFAMESYAGELDAAYESASVDGAKATLSILKTVKGLKREMKAAETDNDFVTAAKKAKEIASHGAELSKSLEQLPEDIGGTILIEIAVALFALVLISAVGTGLFKLKVQATGKLGGAIAGAVTKFMYGDNVRENAKIVSDAFVSGVNAMMPTSRVFTSKLRSNAKWVTAAYTLKTFLIKYEEEGTIDPTAWQKWKVNDINSVIGACKVIADYLYEQYTELANAYTARAKEKQDR